MTRVEHMCCNSDGVFVALKDGSMWWRRHEWLADRWAPVGFPGATDRRRVSGKTATRKRRPRR